MNAAASPPPPPRRPHGNAAGRRTARHCPELLGEGPSLGELAPALAMAGERLARAFAEGLAKLDAGAAAQVRAAMPHEARMQDLAAAAALVEPPALPGIHVQLAIGVAGHRALASFEGAALLRMIDRLFGGRGRLHTTAGPALPLSAELLLARLEEVLTLALAQALGVAGDSVQALRRESELRLIDAFPAHEEMLVLSLEVRDLDGERWHLPVAFPQPTLAALLAPPRRRVIPSLRPERHAGPSDPTLEPFASLPIALTAVLVDMPIAFARLSELKPGDVLPVTVARHVPLQIGGRTFATGTIGEIDDRVAVQIAFPERTERP
ncbi:FliM/FliN family flagellar motor switch protein [Novosphingobium sp. 9]|uniref:FliM/FliN family flagellar motor switch protein n=1 Tax=Novosphingobium sp. 9 TaxID=2025349 RepID=UPI0021B5118A|nr:FliM/FliN family flagellar motor switch protein [Novosphingobium sp. 9]